MEAGVIAAQRRTHAQCALVSVCMYAPAWMAPSTSKREMHSSWLPTTSSWSTQSSPSLEVAPSVCSTSSAECTIDTLAPCSPLAGLRTHGYFAACGVVKCAGSSDRAPSRSAVERSCALLFSPSTTSGGLARSFHPLRESFSRCLAMRSAALSVAGRSQRCSLRAPDRLRGGSLSSSSRLTRSIRSPARRSRECQSFLPNKTTWRSAPLAAIGLPALESRSGRARAREERRGSAGGPRLPTALSGSVSASGSFTRSGSASAWPAGSGSTSDSIFISGSPSASASSSGSAAGSAEGSVSAVAEGAPPHISRAPPLVRDTSLVHASTIYPTLLLCIFSLALEYSSTQLSLKR
eukprot:scaffold100706_cov31-Tisochrysis_lutea.AAC.1